MNFDFDSNKSKANRQKHGITLQEAQRIWEGPHIEIPARSSEEERSVAIGKVGSRLYSCIFTIRSKTIRLISARRSRKKEEALYYEHIKT